MSYKNQKLIIYRIIKLIFNFEIKHIIDHYIDTFISLRKKSGIKYTIAYYKAVKLHITRYMCGQPLMVNQSVRIKLTKGFPSRFLYFKDLLDHNTSIRILLTLLTWTRSVKPTKKESLNLKPDYSTITSPSKGKRIIIPISFIEEFVKRYDLATQPPLYSRNSFYLSSKASPNGPATYGSNWSPRILSEDQIKYINNIVNDGFKATLNTVFKYAKSSFTDYLCDVNDIRCQYTGKLGIVKDPELKLRIIAMVDYLSQCILRPIHDSLLICLRKLPCDRTFTQDPFKS